MLLCNVVVNTNQMQSVFSLTVKFQIIQILRLRDTLTVLGCENASHAQLLDSLRVTNEQRARTSIRLYNHRGGTATVHRCMNAPCLPQSMSCSQPIVDMMIPANDLA